MTARTCPALLLAIGCAVTSMSSREARGLPFNSTDTVRQPVVCDLFEDFCDCAACFVLDRAGACDACPDL